MGRPSFNGYGTNGMYGVSDCGASPTEQIQKYIYFFDTTLDDNMLALNHLVRLLIIIKK